LISFGGEWMVESSCGVEFFFFVACCYF